VSGSESKSELFSDSDPQNCQNSYKIASKRKLIKQKLYTHRFDLQPLSVDSAGSLVNQFLAHPLPLKCHEAEVLHTREKFAFKEFQL
jgi:hypothetical protein